MSWNQQQPYGGGPPPGQQYPPQGYGSPPFQGYPPQQPYGQAPPQGYPPQGQAPPQGYPPQGQYPHEHGGYPPQQPYGAPPPQGGYPPQQPYGAPPPQGGYPPQQPYGAPPPQGGYPPQQPYGAPPPQGGYPPQQPYGAPPPQAYQQQPPYGQPQQPPFQQPYGAPGGLPAPGVSGPPAPPSPGYVHGQMSNYNASADVEAVRKACKGFNTDEKALIHVLTKLDPLQIETINVEYNRETKKSLISLIEDKTRGSLEDGLRMILQGPLGCDVWLLHHAMAGAGTKEVYLNDVLLGRKNADMKAIKEQYHKMYHKSLDDAIKNELSGKTERLYLMAAACTRAEESTPVNPQQVEADVRALHVATEGQMGTDEVQVCSILTQRSDAQIKAIAEAFERAYMASLEKVIKKEFSGDMEDALLFIVRGAINKPKRDAQLIHETMAGAGTKDEELTSRLVRAHWTPGYTAQIKREYRTLEHKDLVAHVKSETSGDHEKLLVALIG